METYGVTPRDLTTVKALMGDSSDNIPGVKGVGEKTALALVKQYKTLDDLYANLENIKGALKEKLISGKEIAYISYELAKINCDVPVDFDYQEASRFHLSSPEALA